MPSVSIILPTYNVVRLLKEAIASVRAQTRSDWELIVIDDGSTDGTAAYIEELADPRIRLIRSQHIGNPGLLRNRAIATARAGVLALIDSDDIWEPRKLEIQLPLLEGHPGAWSYTATLPVDEHGNARTDIDAAWRPHSGYILEQLLRIDARVPASTFMVSRSAFDAVGGFDVASGIEDYDLFIRLAPRYEVFAVDTVLCRTRARPGSFQSDRIMAHHEWQGVYRRAAEASTDSRIQQLCAVKIHRHRLSEAEYLARSGRRAAAAGLLVRSIAPALRHRAGWKTFWATTRSVVRV